MLRNRNNEFVWIFYIFLLVLTLTNGFEVDSVKEGLCDNSNPHISKDFNFKWASTAAGKWYFPLLSKLEFYRSIEDILPGKPLDKFTEEVAQESCFTMKFTKQTEITINGFGGAQFQYALTPTGKNTIQFKAGNPNGKDGLRRSAYVTLTDNRNYIVFINCWKDGFKSWSVASLKKQLSNKAKDKIKRHLQSMGFNIQHAYEQNYASCNENTQVEKEEL